MFCPKCGSENTDDARFCRGCGANLSGVLAIAEGKSTGFAQFDADEPDELFSKGIRNIVIGFGLLAVSILLFTMPPRDGIFWLLMMIPAISFLASGISRIVKVNRTNAGKPVNSVRQNPLPENQTSTDAAVAAAALPPSQTEYVSSHAAKSAYTTNDLLQPQSFSVTEPTTRHLQMETESETKTLPKE